MSYDFASTIPIEASLHVLQDSEISIKQAIDKGFHLVTLRRVAGNEQFDYNYFSGTLVNRPKAWWWYFKVAPTEEAVKQLMAENDARIADVDVYNVDAATRMIAVVLYKRQSAQETTFFYLDRSIEEINALLAQHKACLLSLDPSQYVSGNKWKFAAVMITKHGEFAAGTKLYSDMTLAQIRQHAQNEGQRPMRLIYAFGTVQTPGRWYAICQDNSPKIDWWILDPKTHEDIAAGANENSARVVSVEMADGGKHAAVLWKPFVSIANPPSSPAHHK